MEVAHAASFFFVDLAGHLGGRRRGGRMGGGRGAAAVAGPAIGFMPGSLRGRKGGRLWAGWEGASGCGVFVQDGRRARRRPLRQRSSARTSGTGGGQRKEGASARRVEGAGASGVKSEPRTLCRGGRPRNASAHDGRSVHRVLRVERTHPMGRAWPRAARVFGAEGSLPSPFVLRKTVYGLGVARSMSAVTSDFRGEGSPEQHPLIAQVIGEEDARHARGGWASVGVRVRTPRSGRAPARNR